jgi:hypothetical protein
VRRSAVAGTSVEISWGMIDCCWWRGFVGESPRRSRNSGQGKRMMASPCLLPQGGKLSSGFKCSACSFQQRCLLRIKSRILLVRRQSRASRRYPFPGLYSHHHCGYSLQISLPFGFGDRRKTHSATRATPQGSSSTVKKGLQQDGLAVKEAKLGKLTFRPSLGELVVFKEGKSPEQLRAAAYLRATCFCTYPEGRSEEALKVQQPLCFFHLCRFVQIP